MEPPSFWDTHPKTKTAVKLGLDTLPALGAMTGEPSPPHHSRRDCQDSQLKPQRWDSGQERGAVLVT